MKHLDLFSGYGGFSIVCEKYGIETIGFSEIEKQAIAVLKNKYPNIKNYGDINEINCDELPDFDLLTGGSPCQDLSVAGKQAGLAGERSGLFFQIIRILKEKQPANFIWENVKGALSSQNGWDFARVQIEMAEAGYAFQWQVLNAKYFGVPQSRQRVFVIGHLGNKCPREIFFEQTDGGKNLKFVGSLGNTKKWNNDGKDLSRNSSQGERVYDPTGIAACQSANGGGQGAKTGLYAILQRPRGNNIGGIKKLCPTISVNSFKDNNHVVSFVDLSTNSSKTTDHARAIQARYAKGYSKHSGEISGVTVPVLTHDRIEKRQNGRRFKENGEEMFTLTGQDKHGVYNGYRIRRLTPLECERLMSLSDSWTRYGMNEKGLYGLSDNARYKLCGNGVVVNVVEEIIKRLI
jgi:DNA (cytosine-5)-methyltransferase 1